VFAATTAWNSEAFPPAGFFFTQIPPLSLSTPLLFCQEDMEANPLFFPPRRPFPGSRDFLPMGLFARRELLPIAGLRLLFFLRKVGIFAALRQQFPVRGGQFFCDEGFSVVWSSAGPETGPGCFFDGVPFLRFLSKRTPVGRWQASVRSFSRLLQEVKF